MIAGIEFDIHYDFDKYVKYNGDGCDYSVAINVLNEIVEKLVKRNKLTFLYKHKRVKVILPIEQRDCGNIFSTYWNGVSIRCEIDCEYDDFDWSKFDVGVCPDNFTPLLKFVG